MRLRRLSATLWLLAMAGNALASPFYAPPAPEPDAPPWSGESELGFTHLAGNTDSQTLIAKGRLVWLTGPLTHSLRGEVRHVTQDDETSAEQYLVAMRERYEIQGPHYLFGFARWDKDRFSGYDNQFTTIAGYGRQLLDSDAQSLSLEAGPGYRFDSVRDAEDEQLAVLYGAMDYRWKFSDSASFSQELSVEATDDNTTSRSLTSLTARLTDHLALKLSHEIEHNSRPPETATARTDLTTSASVLFDW
ncbi:DUF481 domain-containing protein [Halomonas stenophila]|uniref:Putative salt-induced outer membrane protein n=1 Tax=Halomonas stenophila TaxID=795312 RepID=A0A7W5HKI1_9GAMM|nr:DUF481 domain-containing protein [Halomonas stenophila]MBB3230053.1 putative salt-induced outer membrane protein [Halomonas stenophila]